MNTEMQRNTVSFDGDETTIVLDGVVYILGYEAEHGWYVIDDGEFTHYYSGRVACATFRLLIDGAMLRQEQRRIAEQRGRWLGIDNRPYVPVALEAADYLPY